MKALKSIVKVPNLNTFALARLGPCLALELWIYLMVVPLF